MERKPAKEHDSNTNGKNYISIPTTEVFQRDISRVSISVFFYTTTSFSPTAGATWPSLPRFRSKRTPWARSDHRTSRPVPLPALEHWRGAWKHCYHCCCSHHPLVLANPVLLLSARRPPPPTFAHFPEKQLPLPPLPLVLNPPPPRPHLRYVSWVDFSPRQNPSRPLRLPPSLPLPRPPPPPPLLATTPPPPSLLPQTQTPSSTPATSQFAPLPSESDRQGKEAIRPGSPILSSSLLPRRDPGRGGGPRRGRTEGRGGGGSRGRGSGRGGRRAAG
jgi:hypothetical protein